MSSCRILQNRRVKFIHRIFKEKLSKSWLYINALGELNINTHRPEDVFVSFRFLTLLCFDWLVLVNWILKCHKPPAVWKVRY